MPINKVIYDEKTLIDISNSTVSPDNMLEGTVAYSASGDKIYGLMQGIRLEDPVDAEATQQIRDVYSTTERKIGTWIDGKPIYRKVFTGLDICKKANAWTGTGVFIQNGDTLVNGRVLRKDSEKSAVGSYIATAINVNTKEILYFGTMTFASANMLIAEYTKTTD